LEPVNRVEVWAAVYLYLHPLDTECVRATWW
jgi:hypothetical protein